MSFEMKVILLILAVTILIVVYDIIQTKRLVAIGVQQTEKTIAFERRLQNPQFSFLIVGDSSAVGVGAVDPTTTIAGRLGADFPTCSISNLGVSGSKTHELIPRLEQLPADEHFELILIQIGGNDIVRFTPLSDLKRDLPIVLSLAKQHSDNVFLLTSGNVGTSKLLPFGTRWLFTWRTKKVRHIFMNESSKSGVTYIDLYRALKDDPYARDPAKFYSADFFHPSGDGYGDWYSFVKPAIDQKMLQ